MRHITSVFSAIYLPGAKNQYLGRLLGTAGVKAKYYPILLGISAIKALRITRVFA